MNMNGLLLFPSIDKSIMSETSSSLAQAAGNLSGLCLLLQVHNTTAEVRPYINPLTTNFNHNNTSSITTTTTTLSSDSHQSVESQFCSRHLTVIPSCRRRKINYASRSQSKQSNPSINMRAGHPSHNHHLPYCTHLPDMGRVCVCDITCTQRFDFSYLLLFSCRPWAGVFSCAGVSTALMSLCTE